MKTAWLAAAAWLLLCGCHPAEHAAPPAQLAHRPPSAKDVIDAVLASSQAPLSDASCRDAGTEHGDSTIGRYLAGYLAEISKQDSRNAITTSVETGTEGGVAVYICRLMVRHAEGEDVWSWGVQFSARKSDGVVLTGSFRCLGAG